MIKRNFIRFIVICTLFFGLFSCTSGSNGSGDYIPNNNGGQNQGGNNNPNEGSNNDERWSQDKFILSTFKAIPNVEDLTLFKKILRLTKMSGINLVEITFIYGDAVNLAAIAADEVNIPLLVEDTNIFTGVGGDNVPPGSDERIRERINELKEHRSVYGYYVWDEPKIENLDKIRDVSSIMDELDPGRLKFSVLFPSYGDYTWNDDSYRTYVDTYLDRVKPEVVSFDYYPFREHDDNVTLFENDMWKDFGYIRKKALQIEKPLWFYFQAIYFYDDPVTALDIDRVKVQMYSALSYGVKGLSYFTSNYFLLDKDYEKASNYDEITALNNKIVDIGNFLFDKKNLALYHSGVKQSNIDKYFLNKVEESDIIESIPDNLIVGVFEGDNKEVYLMITNKDFSNPIFGEIKLKKSFNISLYDSENKRFDIEASSKDSFDFNIPPGEGVLIKLD